MIGIASKNKPTKTNFNNKDDKLIEIRRRCSKNRMVTQEPVATSDLIDSNIKKIRRARIAREFELFLFLSACALLLMTIILKVTS